MRQDIYFLIIYIYSILNFLYIKFTKQAKTMLRPANFHPHATAQQPAKAGGRQRKRKKSFQRMRLPKHWSLKTVRAKRLLFQVKNEVDINGSFNKK